MFLFVTLLYAYLQFAQQIPQVMPVSVPVQNLAYAAQQSGAGGSVVLLQPNSNQAQPGPSHSPNSKWFTAVSIFNSWI